MPALTLMSLFAFSVSVASVPADFVSALLTLMSPAWVPVLPVSMLTLVPALSAVLMTVLRIVELSAAGLNVGDCPSRLPVVDWIVTLRGSSSH